MTKITVGHRLRYWFDRTLSRGPVALIGWLLLVSAAIMACVLLVIVLTRSSPQGDNGHPLGLRSLAWISLLSTLDTGEIENVSGDSVFLGAVLVSTLGGIFVASTLIGLLTNGITNQLDVLRKGRTLVVEENHTIILGWSSHVFSLLSQLILANANQKHAAIVILAERDKVEMEDEIHVKIGASGTTRIICRTGSPIDLTDLEIVNPHRARTILIPAPDTVDPDAYVIKAMLAITNNPKRRPDPYHIVAELHDARNLEVARLVGRDEAQLISANEVIARITAQTCRQSGLSVVYTELLDFGGDEIYFHEERELVGKTFGEALLAYEDSALIGLRLSDGRVQVNPPMDSRIAAGDKLIAVSQDDDTIRLSRLGPPQIDLDAIRQAQPSTPVLERTLILGWNTGAPAIINELDNYVAYGSVVTVIADLAELGVQIAGQCGGLRNQTVTFQRGETTNRRVLDDLVVSSYDHVITLSTGEGLDVQAVDSRTLMTLLHLRDIVSKTGSEITIVSEMLDVRNRQLAEVTRADDFIVSDQLVSLMLSQIAENKELLAVFTDLFDADGSELYLKPATDYVEPGRPLTFYTVVEAARQRGEVAIGYRLLADARNASEQYGVRVNPRKSAPVTFSEGDRIIVVAED